MRRRRKLGRRSSVLWSKLNFLTLADLDSLGLDSKALDKVKPKRQRKVCLDKNRVEKKRVVE